MIFFKLNAPQKRIYIYRLLHHKYDYFFAAFLVCLASLSKFSQMQGNFNFWSIVLLISIGQALFLSIILVIRKSRNPISSRLLLFLIISILIVNLDYFLISSSLYKKFPDLIGFSFGLMYVFGPLFYLYLRSVADSSFKWKQIHWLHFLPWTINLIYNRGFYLLDENIKIAIVNSYLESKSAANGSFFYVMNSLQIVHLSIYLIVFYKFLRQTVKDDRHQIPISKRIVWLKTLFYANFVFVLSFLTWFLIVCLQAVFIPPVDYINTLICSAMVFLIAFKLALNAEVLTPNFDKKYKSSSLSETAFQNYLPRLIELMERDKIYTEPELKLYEVADQLDITPHVLSQIINQKFGKSFIDFVNEYRVEAFKKRLAEIKKEHKTMLSLAMEVGFNSKSAFNAAFKKVAGQTPSEYKKALND